MIAGWVMSLPFTWMELPLSFYFLIMVIMSLIPSHDLNKFKSVLLKIVIVMIKLANFG